MNKHITTFDLYLDDKFIMKGSLGNIAKRIICNRSTLCKKLMHKDEIFFRGYKVVRVKGIDKDEYKKILNQQKLEQELELYYNALYRGLNISGVSIGRYSIPVEEQIKKLTEMGLRGDFRFIPDKEGRHRWYKVELIKASL